MIKLDNEKNIIDLIGKTIKKINVNGINFQIKRVKYSKVIEIEGTNLLYIVGNKKTVLKELLKYEVCTS